jgi:glycosyltransferase involved in cell wall biosynthesis
MSAPPPSPPLVSVVMNCYNGERYVRAALDSVYAQTRPDWEIVFWDNASTDRTPELVRGYDARLRYWRAPRNTLLGAARNAALERCSGEFIAFLDCDDLWLPQKLERQLPLFEDPEVGLVYSNCLLFNERGDERLQFRPGESPGAGRCFDALLARYWLAIPTVILRRSALGPRSEWVDESYSVSEEADLFLRIAYRWKLALVDAPLAKYRVHAASDTWNKSALFLKELCTTVDRLRREIPDFEQRHGAAARRALDWAHYSQAVLQWQTGNGARAREGIRALSTRRAKHLALWVLSFAPFGLFRPLLRRMGRVFPQ